MLYVGIDLHAKQMTVAVRDEKGDVVLRRQVSTRPAKAKEFFVELGRLSDDGQFVTLLEVCGFHDWLVEQLQADASCRAVVLVQPQTRSKRKTDRRDAHQLSEVLWVNRQRLLAGQKVQGVRTVYWPTANERQDRQLTAFRQHLGQRRTQTINQIRHILRRNNLEWERPTKGFQTKKVQKWLRTMSLSELDRWEMDQLLAQWELWERQIAEAEKQIEERFKKCPACSILASIVGVSCYMALALVSRIGDIRRFPSPRSLANYFGLTPGSRNSAETRRPGSITKEGSRIVRFLLGQLVLHVLRRDGKMREWYRRIKQRRGAKIARVAVMRRLTVILWHMLQKQQPYQYGGVPQRSRPRPDDATTACQAVDAEALRQAFVAPAGPRDSSTGSSSLVRG
jgi:transposase